MKRYLFPPIRAAPSTGANPTNQKPFNEQPKNNEERKKSQNVRHRKGLPVFSLLWKPLWWAMA